MKRGFTLPEILLTLAIIGIISAITIPGLAGGTNLRKSTALYAKYCYVLDSALSQAMVLNHVASPKQVNVGMLGEQLNATISGNSLHFKDGAVLSYHQAPSKNGQNYYALSFPDDMNINTRYYPIDTTIGGIDCTDNGQVAPPQ